MLPPPSNLQSSLDQLGTPFGGYAASPPLASCPAQHRTLKATGALNLALGPSLLRLPGAAPRRRSPSDPRPEPGGSRAGPEDTCPPRAAPGPARGARGPAARLRSGKDRAWPPRLGSARLGPPQGSLRGPHGPPWEFRIPEGPRQPAPQRRAPPAPAASWALPSPGPAGRPPRAPNRSCVYQRVPARSQRPRPLPLPLPLPLHALTARWHSRATPRPALRAAAAAAAAPPPARLGLLSLGASSASRGCRRRSTGRSSCLAILQQQRHWLCGRPRPVGHASLPQATMAWLFSSTLAKLILPREPQSTEPLGLYSRQPSRAQLAEVPRMPQRQG